LNQKTTLFETHLANAGKMTDFNGWKLPLNFGSQIEEHLMVRTECGVFDVSNMTILDFKGPSCKSFLRKLLANDIESLTDNADAIYSAILNASGGILDDLIVYKMPFGYRLVVNCATKEKVISWINQHIKKHSAEMTLREDISMLAIQGPNFLEVISQFLSKNLISQLKDKKAFQGVIEDKILVSKTGYTGEMGVEIMVPSKEVKKIWLLAVESGANPSGLGARDTLRLEAGMNLYGFEMNDKISPLECNMAWTVSLEDKKREFIGKKPYELKKEKGDYHTLKGLVFKDKSIVRSNHEVFLDHNKNIKGIVTSGTYSPTLKKCIALARIPPTDKKNCFSEVRGKIIEASIGKPRFVKEGKIVF